MMTESLTPTSSEYMKLVSLTDETSAPHDMHYHMPDETEDLSAIINHDELDDYNYEWWEWDR